MHTLVAVGYLEMVVRDKRVLGGMESWLSINHQFHWHEKRSPLGTLVNLP